MSTCEGQQYIRQCAKLKQQIINPQEICDRIEVEYRNGKINKELCCKLLEKVNSKCINLLHFGKHICQYKRDLDTPLSSDALLVACKPCMNIIAPDIAKTSVLQSTRSRTLFPVQCTELS